MIVLSSNNDGTYKQRRKYLQTAKQLVSLIASLWHNIAPYQGNNLPLPGTKRYVGSFFFIKAPLSFFLFTLHQIGWNPDKHWGCERWRVTHHSSPLFTFGLHTKLNGKSTCSVFEEGPTDLAFPSAADFQFTDFTDFPGEEWVKSGEESSATLHPCKFLSYRYLYHSSEEWRVFLKVACYFLKEKKGNMLGTFSYFSYFCGRSSYGTAINNKK